MAKQNNTPGDYSNTTISTATVGQNPVYGLENTAKDAYRANNSPTWTPKSRAPQLLPSDDAEASYSAPMSLKLTTQRGQCERLKKTSLQPPEFHTKRSSAQDLETRTLGPTWAICTRKAKVYPRATKVPWMGVLRRLNKEIQRVSAEWVFSTLWVTVSRKT